MAAKVGVAVVLSRRNKLIVSGCYESIFFYPFLPAATYLFLAVSTRGSRQNETLTNKMFRFYVTVHILLAVRKQQ